MGLVLWKNKDGAKTWQGEDFDKVQTQWKRVHPNDEPIDGPAPFIEPDEPTPTSTSK